MVSSSSVLRNPLTVESRLDAMLCNNSELSVTAKNENSEMDAQIQRKRCEEFTWSSGFFGTFFDALLLELVIAAEIVPFARASAAALAGAQAFDL